MRLVSVLWLYFSRCREIIFAIIPADLSSASFSVRIAPPRRRYDCADGNPGTTLFSPYSPSAKEQTGINCASTIFERWNNLRHDKLHRKIRRLRFTRYARSRTFLLNHQSSPTQLSKWIATSSPRIGYINRRHWTRPPNTTSFAKYRCRTCPKHAIGKPDSAPRKSEHHQPDTDNHQIRLRTIRHKIFFTISRIIFALTSITSNEFLFRKLWRTRMKAHEKRNPRLPCSAVTVGDER